MMRLRAGIEAKDRYREPSSRRYFPPDRLLFSMGIRFPKFTWTCLLGFALTAAVCLMISINTLWAQTPITSAQERNLDPFREIRKNPKYQDLIPPQLQIPCPTSNTEAWLEEAFPFIAKIVKECLPGTSFNSENAFALIKWGGLAAGIFLGGPATQTAAATVFSGEVADSAAQCLLNIMVEGLSVTEDKKKEYKFYVKTFFEGKDQLELGQTIRGWEWVSGIPKTDLQRYRTGFEFFTNIERITGMPGTFSDARDLALTPDPPTSVGLLDSTQDGIDSAKSAADRCDFEEAFKHLAHAEELQKQTIQSEMTWFRKEEWRLHCLRQLTKYRPSEDGPYVIPAAQDRAWNYSWRVNYLEEKAQKIRKDLALLKELQFDGEVYGTILKAKIEFQPKQRAYERLIKEAEAALANRDLLRACPYVDRLKQAFGDASEACREALLNKGDTRLSSPDDFIAELDKTFKKEERRVIGRLDEIDRSLVQCRLAEARTILKELPDELRKLMRYGEEDSIPISFSGDRVPTRGEVNQKCFIPKQPEIEANIAIYEKWLTEIDEASKDARAKLSKAEEQVNDPCRCEDALKDQGGEAALIAQMEKGCIKGYDSRLDKIKAAISQWHTNAEGYMKTIELARPRLEGMVDPKSDPAHCDVDSARTELAQVTKAIEALRCPADRTPPPSATALARCQQVEPVLQELKDFEMVVNDLARKIETTLANLNQAAGKVKAESDCAKAQKLLDEQKTASQEIIKCLEYRSKIENELQDMTRFIDDKRTEAIQKADAAEQQGRKALDRCDNTLRPSLKTVNDLRQGPAKSCLEAEKIKTLDAVAVDLEAKISAIKICQDNVEQILANIEQDLKVCKLDGLKNLVQQAREAMPEEPCPSNHSEFVEYGRRINDIASRLDTLKANVQERRDKTLLAVKTAQAYLDNWNHRVEWDEARKRDYERHIKHLEPVRDELLADLAFAGCLHDVLDKIRNILAQAVPPPGGETRTASTTKPDDTSGFKDGGTEIEGPKPDRSPAAEPPASERDSAGTQDMTDTSRERDEEETPIIVPAQRVDEVSPTHGFADAGTEIQKPQRGTETVTYFDRQWMPTSWRTSGNSTEVRVNIYEAASRLGWAAALAKYTAGPADELIAQHLRAGSDHVRKVNENGFGPHRPWPDWQQVQAKHEQWARQITQQSKRGRDYFRNSLPQGIEGHGNSLTQALAYQASGRLEQRENCDSYYFRIGFSLAYAAQAYAVAVAGQKGGENELWVNRVRSDAYSRASTASRYIRELKNIKVDTGSCSDLTPIDPNLRAAIQGGVQLPITAQGVLEAWQAALSALGAGQTIPDIEAAGRYVFAHMEENTPRGAKFSHQGILKTSGRDPGAPKYRYAFNKSFAFKYAIDNNPGAQFTLYYKGKEEAQRFGLNLNQLPGLRVVKSERFERHGGSGAYSAAYQINDKDRQCLINLAWTHGDWSLCLHANDYANHPGSMFGGHNGQLEYLFRVLDKLVPRIKTIPLAGGQAPSTPSPGRQSGSGSIELLNQQAVPIK
jgi:hypothetical protein